MLSTDFWKQKVVFWQYQQSFSFYTSSKLSRRKFEFSPKVKVMGSNPDYLLKSFLLYLKIFKDNFILEHQSGYWVSTWGYRLVLFLAKIEHTQRKLFKDYFSMTKIWIYYKIAFKYKFRPTTFTFNILFDDFNCQRFYFLKVCPNFVYSALFT